MMPDMAAADIANEIFLSYSDLVNLLGRIFLAHGASHEVASLLAANCAACERDGSLSHGIFRIPGYVSSIMSGWVDSAAVPTIEDAGPSIARADAANGFSQVALTAAKPLLLEKVRSNGVAILAVRNSHHFSALWPDVEPFAEQGLVALSFVNGFACVVPSGGQRPVFGTNPMAFAAPLEGANPFVFDQASSSLANGDVRIAAREGKLLPAGSGVDRNGELTADPCAILDGGALLPFGGYKGSSIALMVEVLGAALTGGQFSFEVDWSAYPGAETPKTGQLFIVIDPERGGNAGFVRRVMELAERVRSAGQTRLPGDRRYACRQKAAQRGIPLTVTQLDQLQKLATV